MKKLVLFDIDGTLISSNPGKNYKKNRFSESIKKVFGVDVQYNRKKYNGGTDYQIITSLLKNHIPIELVKSNLDILASVMIQNIQDDQERDHVFRLIPGTMQLLDFLSSKEIVLGIFTGNLPKIADWKLSINGIKKYFRYGMYGDKYLTKSDILLNCFPNILNSLNGGTEFKECCLIGDTEEDIKAANKIGISSIGVLGFSISPKNALLREKPFLIVDRLDDKKIIKHILDEN